MHLPHALSLSHRPAPVRFYGDATLPHSTAVDGQLPGRAERDSVAFYDVSTATGDTSYPFRAHRITSKAVQLPPTQTRELRL